MQINKKYLILVLFLLLGANFTNAHPFYVSICQLNYNKETKSLEVSVKVFADDLLLGLENAGRTKIYIGEKKENPRCDAYILDYLKSSYQFDVNGQEASLQFIGKEVESDVVWIYLEIENVAELKSLDVNCSLLIEVLESQSNIVQLNNNGNIKNLLFNKNTTRGTLNF